MTKFYSCSTENLLETTVQEVERSDSTDSKTMSLEESQCLVSNQIEEVPEMNDDDARYLEDKENAEKGIHGEENAGDLVPEESCITEDELPEAKTSKEKFDIMSTEDKKFGDVPENHCDGPIEYSDPSTEAALQCSSIDPIPEPQEKCVIHAEEIDLISCKSEEGENKQDPEAEQRRNELVVNNSAPSMIHQDSSSKENREEAIAQLSSNSCLEKVHHTEETKLTHKRSRSILAGKKSCVPIEQFEDTEEVIKILPILISVSTELSSKENHDEEKRETEQTEDDSSSMPMNNDDKGTANECTLGTDSFKWENENESLLGSEDSEDRNKCTKFNLEEGFANGIQNLESSSESSKTEHAKNIEETEVLSELPNGKTQESSAKLNIESNPSNQQQRSKSPSFDFGLQIDTRSEDSDQTPLLHHDKTAARSFSGFSNVRFQNRIIQTDYGRNSLDFEPVSVEEKTIRMERSDSDISRASFMNLLKKDQKKGNDQFFPQNQESPVANRNSDELSTEEIALNSPKESGKRKNRPSLFTSCICCTAVIH